MPLSICTSSQAAVEIQPLFGPDETPAAEGIEGQKVQAQVVEVLRHWWDRSEFYAIAEVAEDDALDYSIVPLDAAGSVKVKYRYAGQLRPLPYGLDE